jgi:radical SAM superfamily enzyme YgiQ (UPF0313 family)
MELPEKLKSLKKKNRITLFFPSTNPGISPPLSPPLPNLGIGYIGTVLKTHGHQVQCVDGNVICPEISVDEHRLGEYVLEKSLRTIRHTKPDILGVGSWTTNFPFAAELISSYAKKHPNRLIVLGGYQATFLPELVFRLLPQVDVLVCGEGEHTMLELIEAVEKGVSLDRVKGIAYRDGKRIVKTPPRDLIRDLNELPFIDYDLFVGFDPAKAAGLMILTSRGCPFNCVFCSCKAFWRNIRTRSVENIVEEIRRLRDRYAIESFGVCDDLFSVNRKRVLEFCEMLGRERMHMNWTFNARIDTLDGSVIQALRRSGVSRICLGLESVNIRTLRYIGEKHPEQYADTARKLLKLCVSRQVPCKFSTIVGFPNETEEEIQYMLDFVAKARSKGVHIYTGLPVCYPGTRLWDLYRRKEISLTRIKDDNLRRHSSGFFAEKYEHLPECVPSAWMIENSHVASDRIEEMLRDHRSGA